MDPPVPSTAVHGPPPILPCPPWSYKLLSLNWGGLPRSFRPYRALAWTVVPPWGPSGRARTPQIPPPLPPACSPPYPAPTVPGGLCPNPTAQQRALGGGPTAPQFHVPKPEPPQKAVGSSWGGAEHWGDRCAMGWPRGAMGWPWGGHGVVIGWPWGGDGMVMGWS